MLMDQLIEAFPQHINEAVEIFKETNIFTEQKSFQNIVIAGMGGSGIGATLVKDIIQNECKLPVVVSKEYYVPAFVNQHTLFIASSYSGNTEETLNALKDAEKKLATIYVICSGGEMEQIAKKKNYPYLNIPEGMPPRAALGYSFTLLCLLLNKLDITKINSSQLTECAAFLKNHKHTIKKQASEIAEKIHNTIPVLFCAEGFEGATVRACQQLNENSKMLCWHRVVPEMNHNELVAWNKSYSQLSTIFFLSDLTFYRTQKRMQLLANQTQRLVNNQIEVELKGSHLLEQNLFHVHLFDWVSYFASVLNHVDAGDIEVLIKLKSELAQLP
jgi:glucose/mannose-6-phosphate isomerase